MCDLLLLAHFFYQLPVPINILKPTSKLRSTKSTKITFNTLFIYINCVLFFLVLIEFRFCIVVIM